jgi:AraC-like DNA-binding protein
MYQEFRPDRRLTPLVECGWARWGPATRSLRVLPDGCVDLFVGSQGAVMIAGAATTFYDLGADAECVLAGLRLRPGAAAAVIGRPVDEFTDRQLPMGSIFGRRGDLVAEKVLTATTPRDRVTALQDMLIGYLARAEPSVDTAVTRVIGVLQQHPEQPVSRLAATVDLSERQLRRRFESSVGYGPKRFGRTLRFQRLLDLIRCRDAPVRWAELAAEAGYADQPHLIKECLALAGVSPVGLPGGMSVSSNTAAGERS